MFLNLTVEISLNFTAKPAPDYFKANFERLQSDLGINDEFLLANNLGSSRSDLQNLGDKYSNYLLAALNQILSNQDLDSDETEELISINKINLLSKIVVEAVTVGLTPYLPQSIVLPLKLTTPVSVEGLTEERKLTKLKLATNSLVTIFEKKILANQPLLENCLIQYIFSLFYLLSHDKISTESVDHCKIIISREQYFRYLMLFKGLRGLPLDLAKILHRRLLNELQLSGGFEILCRLLLKNTSEAAAPDWQRCEVVARIVSAKGHIVNFYSAVTDAIFQFLRASLLVKEQEIFIPVCVQALQQLLTVVPDELKTNIEEKLTNWLTDIKNPPETLAGSILLSNEEFYELLNMTFSCFGGLPMVKLPSKILLPHQSSLFHLYCLAELIENKATKEYVATILNYVLNNRNTDELRDFIQLAINFGRDTNSFKRIILKNSTKFPTPSVNICAEEEIPNIDGSKHLLNLIKNSSNTILMYNIFIILLEMLQMIGESSTASGDLLDTDDPEQLGELLSQKFFQRYTIIEILQELITFKPLHQQFMDNPGKMIEFIENLLQKQIDSSKKPEQIDTHLTILLLTVFNELINSLKNPELQTQLRRKIQKFKEVTQDSEAREQLNHLLNESSANPRVESDFQEALRLCCSNEAHIKVNGTIQLMKLINKKDPETIVNRFKTLAIAMINLKHVESYAYLNTVRLLVALTNLIEAEVIDTLLSEFKNENFDTDHRLKLGEVIVKIAEGLGPIAYKYKNELINSFLRGCLDKKDEIRASSFSKLGTICKILTFQVHQFFQEMLTIIKQTLDTDQYLPTRRAAVMVLSQVLEGMNNIIDNQEFLLPVYRCLKNILLTETDEVTRVHAALSLETIKKLVKEFLNPEQRSEFEIRVSGIAQKKNTMEIKYK